MTLQDLADAGPTRARVAAGIDRAHGLGYPELAGAAAARARELLRRIERQPLPSTAALALLRLADELESLPPALEPNEHAARELRGLLEAGPDPAEGFYRVKATGSEATRWFNVSPETLEAVAALLSSSEPGA